MRNLAVFVFTLSLYPGAVFFAWLRLSVAMGKDLADTIERTWHER